MSKYSHINFKPPQSVRDEVKQALAIDPKLRGRGLESATVAMASKIARGESISPEQARKGYRFWSRNERFLKEDKDSAAWVSAKFWGGRSGMSWYRKLYRQIEAADNEEKGANEIEANADASKSIMDSLRKKAKDHNEDAKHKVTAEKLYKIFKRGVGAYKTNPQSVKPGVSGSTEWGHRRVNAWLIALESGKFKSGAFDTDLLPKDHPAKNSESDVLDYKQVNTGLSDMNKLLLQTNVSKSMISE